MQMPILGQFCIQKKYSVWFFTSSVNEGPVFSKVLTWIWFGHIEGA